MERRLEEEREKWLERIKYRKKCTILYILLLYTQSMLFTLIEIYNCDVMIKLAVSYIILVYTEHQYALVP